MIRQILRNRSIRWKLGVHLLLILALLAVNLGVVWLCFTEETQTETALDTIDQQKLLTQTMTAEAHRIGMGETDRRDELATAATQYDRQLTALVDGNESMGVPSAPPNIRPHLVTLSEEWGRFSEHVETLLEEPPTSPAFAASLDYIETHTDELLAGSQRAETRYEHVHSEQLSTFQQLLLVIFLFDALLIASVFKFTEWHVIQPLETIASEARRIAEGHTDQQLSVTDSTDEVGTLSQSIREMKQQLVSTVQQTRRFSQAVEYAGTPIYITDTDGTIRYVNPAFENVTQYDEQSVLGEHLQMLHAEEQSEDYDDILEHISAGDTWQEEIVSRRATGELFHASQTIAPVTDEDGVVSEYVAILNDNTERRVREQQTQVLNRVLRHNLRNELNVMELSAQSLLNGTDPESKNEHVHTILERIDTLDELSDKTSRLSSVVQADEIRQSQSVSDTVERVCARMEGRHSAIDITVYTEDADVVVRTNFDLVLEELLENAIVHNDQLTPEIDVRATVQDETPSTVEVTIEDNGPGIPRYEREIIEEGKETSLYHGSGLGLWIVNWLTTLAGGTISLENGHSCGTAITLVLPCFADSSSTPRSEPPAQ